MLLVLASASPRRADLLRAAGFEFEVIPVDVNESPHPNEDPATYVLRLARDKSAGVKLRIDAGSRLHPVVLGADTVVVLDGEILGKPSDEAHAASMLTRLSGRTHRVLTGLSVRQEARELGLVETTSVEFGRLSDSDLRWYLSSGEWRDKAGAYAIQGLASRFIGRIEGSYSNVVGLPVAAFCDLLQRLTRLASVGETGYSDERGFPRKSL